MTQDFVQNLFFNCLYAFFMYRQTVHMKRQNQIMEQEQKGAIDNAGAGPKKNRYSYLWYWPVIAMAIMVIGLNIPWIESKYYGKQYFPFEKAVAQFGMELGKKRSDPQIFKEDAYQGIFEHAISIWTTDGSYVLWDDEGQPWEPLIEGSFPPDDPWASDEKVRKMLGLPASCRPPIKSMAFQWSKDPTKWSRIGCRQFQCPSAPAYYQEFENGIIMGTFRSELEGNTAGIVYVVISKPTRYWRTVTIETSLRDENGLEFIPKKGSGNCSL